MDSIREFFQQPEVVRFITAIFSFLAANLLTIIVFAIKYLKLKTQEIKNKIESDLIISKLTAEYNKKIEEFAARIDASLTKVEGVVIKKVNEKEAKRDEEIKKETILLTQAIAETKKALNIDDNEDA